MTTRQKWILGSGIFLIGGLFLLFIGDTQETLTGLGYIWTHPSILVSDYLLIGGLLASLLNMWILVFASTTLLGLSKTKLNGLHIAGLFTIAGFAFFGKTLLNALPIWIGIFIYSKFKKKAQAKLLGAYFFGTAIGPVVSFVWFSSPVSFPLQMVYGTTIGILTGILIPILSSVAVRFHQGYNLYNIGFTIGLLATIYQFFFQLINWEITLGTEVSTEYSSLFYFVFSFLFLILIIVGLLTKASWHQTTSLHANHGRKADFIELFGLPAVLVNMGLLGLFSLGLLLFLELPIHGPMIAGILTLVGFGAYGKHLVNSIPVMLGAYLYTLLPQIDIQAVGPSIAILFVTALAPITLKFGLITALAAGFIHVYLGPIGLNLQGGFALYNNGFVAGFVAALIVGIDQMYHYIRKKLNTNSTLTKLKKNV
jgi:hypothetical protein